MPSIGIIANPASGKDIRRLVSYATVIDNNEKLNMVKRIILAAQGMGVEHVYIMPDSFQMGYTAAADLKLEEKLKANIHLLDMKITASMQDSTTAAKMMSDLAVPVILVLGGDGTSRAVCKGMNGPAILPLSTGTNNVYPSMIEATVAGMAAAYVSVVGDKSETCIVDKHIEVRVNGEFRDIALIDALLADGISIGSRAIWDYSLIEHLIVTRSHPASIGFSSVAGSLNIVAPEDDFGAYVKFGGSNIRVKSAIAAGVISEFSIEEYGKIDVDKDYSIPIEKTSMVALDGEREIRVVEGDTLELRIKRGKVRRVLVNKTLELAKQSGFFKVGS